MRINDDGSTTFRYIGLHASPSSTESWTDAQGNKNPVRITSNEKVSSNNTYATPTEDTYKAISLANVQIARPLVDQPPAENASVFSPRFTSSAITWTAAGEAVSGAFDFDTTYTATFTLTAAEGYTFADSAAVSVNKEYVGPAPGVKNHEAESVAVSEDGKADYAASPADVVIRGGKLVSATTPSMVFTAQKDADGYLLWSDASLLDGQGASTLNFLSMSTRGGDLGLEAAEAAGMSIYNNWNTENGLTSDMVFTAVGNDADGYALKTGNQYLAGRPVDDSPDKWGFMLTDNFSSAVTFIYQDGKLKVVSTGASGGPGGPPPSASDSFLYLSGDHFNFGTLQSTELTIEALYLPFTDVQADRRSRDAIYDMAATGTMLGMDQTKFAPTGTMTRAMAITVLYRMAGSPETAGTVKYTDTQATAYYADALVWGTQSGIVNGYASGTFRPNEPVTRQQFAAMLQRFMTHMGLTPEEKNDVTFKDADTIGDYAKDAVALCAKAGIINGYKDGTFRPTSRITREEAAAMLSRLLDLMQ